MLILVTMETLFPNCSYKMMGQMCSWSNSAEIDDTTLGMSLASYAQPCRDSERAVVQYSGTKAM